MSSATMWQSVAPGWGEHADYVDARGAGLTARLLELARVAPGDRVLELACGAGGLGLAAAERADGARGLGSARAQPVAWDRARCRERAHRRPGAAARRERPVLARRRGP